MEACKGTLENRKVAQEFRHKSDGAFASSRFRGEALELGIGRNL